MKNMCMLAFEQKFLKALKNRVLISLGTHPNELLTIKNKGRKANDGYTFITDCPERETETQSETRFQMFDVFCLFICLF